MAEAGPVKGGRIRKKKRKNNLCSKSVPEREQLEVRKGEMNFFFKLEVDNLLSLCSRVNVSMCHLKCFSTHGIPLHICGLTLR